MNFITTEFFTFVLGLVALVYIIPQFWRQWVVIGASYVFYAYWSIEFIVVILVTTSVDYFLSHRIYNNPSKTKQKQYLALGITINLLVLMFFKYYTFASETVLGLSQLIGSGQSVALPHLDIILPLGISFYTFEAISYLVDVYRGDKPATNFRDYNFFIMYFPHLISGPIIRFQELFAQYKNGITLPDNARVMKALELIVLGAFFKIVVADMVAPLADKVFGGSMNAMAFYTIMGALAFTVQIYYDFLGYTHIARGVSLLFNIELPLNFNLPYLATNPSDFWRRWHISLSRWLKDYLYIPLGGSKKGLPQTISNLLITMFLAGLWHGAGWGYVLWGVYHGVLLILNKCWQQVKQSNDWFTVPSSLYKVSSIVITFTLVVLGWVLFRSPSLGHALGVYKNMFSSRPYETVTSDMIFTFVVLVFLCLGNGWVVNVWNKTYDSAHQQIQLIVLVLIALVAWLMHSDDAVPFIYYQF